MKNIFKQIISDFHSRPIQTIKERNLKVEINTGKIVSIIWPRRAGKSYYLFWLINDLIKKWVDKTDILYINFEDERLDIEWNKLQILVDAYYELYNNKNLNESYLFFDEIQNIDGWEKFIRRIYDEGNKNIFITWSNAKLLSKEIATSLRWRNLSYELLPLSFDEYLWFKWENLNIYTTKDKAKVLNLQKEYMKWWWFPELVDFNEDIKIKTLQEYFDVMLYNDIIERYKVKDSVLLKQFVKFLIQTSTKEYSINKIWNNLKSLWFKFDKNILYNFIDYLNTIYFGKSISKFEYSLNKQTLKKFFLFDNGYLNALSFKFSDDYGKLLENMVFIELYKRHQDKIYFLKNWSETDFILHKKEKEIYQICYNLTDENYDREINWCLDAMKKFKINKSYIITNEQEEIIKINRKQIILIPFYKWILEK